MAVIYSDPCPYTGFIPYDYPPDFEREWSIESRLAGLMEVYAQRIRASSGEHFSDFRELERKTYLKNRFEEFRDSVIRAIRRSEQPKYNRIGAEDRVSALYGSFLKSLGFIDECGNLLPSFEPLIDELIVESYALQSPVQAEPEELDLSRVSSFLDAEYGISGSFKRGFLREEYYQIYA